MFLSGRSMHFLSFSLNVVCPLSHYRDAQKGFTDVNRESLAILNISEVLFFEFFLVFFSQFSGSDALFQQASKSFWFRNIYYLSKAGVVVRRSVFS